MDHLPIYMLPVITIHKQERERMEMTQMRHEDDDMIELHKTLESQCRDDTIMEITIQGGDDIVDLYNTLAIGCTITLKSLIDKDPRILHKISLTTFSETPLHISDLLGHLDFTKTLLTQNPLLAVKLDSHKRCSFIWLPLRAMSRLFKNY